MTSPNLHAALARLDVMDETLATLRGLADAYADDGEDAGHVARYVHAAVAWAAEDLAVLAGARQVEASCG